MTVKEHLAFLSCSTSKDPFLETSEVRKSESLLELVGLLVAEPFYLPNPGITKPANTLLD